jgi:hypothetical protein
VNRAIDRSMCGDFTSGAPNKHAIAWGRDKN